MRHRIVMLIVALVPLVLILAACGGGKVGGGY
jgi:hypothetical protein